MSERNYTGSYGLTFNEYISRVFGTIAIGLAITTVTSLLFTMLYSQIGASLFYIALGSCLLELGVAIYFSARLRSMSKQSAWVCFIVYAVLTGISLTGILLEYTYTSIAVSFGVTTIMFISMAVVGHTTKVDLTKFSGLLLPALIAIILATVLNAFIFRNSMLSWIITYLGIIIFLGLIAYDMQMLRNLYMEGIQDSELGEKLMIMGAFQLYLDFINLFIRIVQIFGKRRD